MTSRGTFVSHNLYYRRQLFALRCLQKMQIDFGHSRFAPKIKCNVNGKLANFSGSNTEEFWQKNKIKWKPSGSTLNILYRASLTCHPS